MVSKLDFPVYSRLVSIDSLCVSYKDNSQNCDSMLDRLSKTVPSIIKNRLCWHIYDLDGRVSADPCYGENHLVDSLPRLEEAIKRTSLELIKDLPKEFKHRLYWHIYDLDGASSIELDYGKKHVVDSLPLLREAIRRVAFEVFDTISQPERDLIASQVWQLLGSPQTNDPYQWGAHYAKVNHVVLLVSLNNLLRDLTPQFEMILNDWAAEQGENLDETGASHTAVVVEAIKSFLKRKEHSLANGKAAFNISLIKIMISANVSSLPPVFDKKPLTSRLAILSLYDNRMTAIPKEICQLSELKFLRFSNNCSVSESLINNSIKLYHQGILTVPSEIGKLSNLEYFSLSDSGVESLPSEIGNLHELKSIYLDQTPNLRKLPEEIFHLSPSCNIDLHNSYLIHSQIAIDNLEQTTYHNPDYNGPQFNYPSPIPIGIPVEPEPIDGGELNVEDEVLIPAGFFGSEED